MYQEDAEGAAVTVAAQPVPDRDRSRLDLVEYGAVEVLGQPKVVAAVPEPAGHALRYPYELD